MLNLKSIDKSWTLFLDRDGVINYENPVGYILDRKEFKFYKGVPAAIQFLSEKFRLIIVATNQRGLGKGLMTEEDLLAIHDKMTRDILEAGGRIDKIYYSTSLSDQDPLRKPNPGMAFKAVKDFPQIDLKKSLMVGNTLSDMQFGRNAGMHTIFLKTTLPQFKLPDPNIDLAFHDLPEFAIALQKS
jgi:D-glycero-D-manno-heptose 1,7-bisphosphate phosphatase